MSFHAGHAGAMPDGRHPSSVRACRLAVACWLRQIYRGFGHRWWLLAVLPGVLALAGCNPPAPPPLTVGLNPWVGYDPLVLAREQGQIDPVRVKVVELSTNAEVLRHFRNGLLDGMATTLDQTLQLAEEGLDLRIVAVLDTSAGADVVMATPLLTSPQALRGARIAVEPSTLGQLVLRRMLDSTGMTLADVTVVPLEASQHLAALQSGRIAAAVSYDPLAAQLRSVGYVPVFDSRQMEGEILDVLVVRADVLARRAGDVEVLLQAWNAGLASIESDGAGAAAQLAGSIGLSASEYLQTLSGLKFFSPADSLAYFSGSPMPLKTHGERLAQSLQAMQMLRSAPDWDRLFDAGPATRALAVRSAP